VLFGSCTRYRTHYIGGRSENNIKCVVHDDLGWKNQTIRNILPHHWLCEWFSQFHSCGTYSVLSLSPSIGSMLLERKLISNFIDTSRVSALLYAYPMSALGHIAVIAFLSESASDAYIIRLGRSQVREPPRHISIHRLLWTPWCSCLGAQTSELCNRSMSLVGDTV